MATVIRLVLILGFLGIFSLESGFAQSIGDYRSRQTGTWDDINTWERWNGSAWVNPTLTEFDAELYDMSGVANNPFTIRAPHIVTVSTDVLLMNVGKVEVGAKLVVTHAALFYNNGADLIISGTLETSAGGFILDNAIAGTLKFNLPGSTYIHNRDGGIIPLAYWEDGSICMVQGITTTVPIGLIQSFSDFSWNCPGQASNLNLDGQLSVMSGSLQILNTNGFSLALTALSPLSLNIQNLYVNGANTIFYLAKNGTAMVDITCAGSFIQVNGSTRVGSGHHATINVNQNFLHQAGTIIVEPNAVFRGNFNGSTLQQWQSIPSQITGNANFAISNASHVEAISDIAVPGQYLELNIGNLILHNNNIHLGFTTTATGAPSNFSFIETNGQGAVIKATNIANPSFTFPVGSMGLYAPINIHFTVFTPPTTSGTVSVRTVENRHPLEPSVNDYLNRYWDFISTIPGQFDATAYYDILEVSGNEANLFSKYFSELNGVWFRQFPANIPLKSLIFTNLDNLIFSGTPRKFFFSAGEELSIEVTQPNISDMCKGITESQAMMLIKIYNAMPSTIPMLTDINLHTRGSTDPVTDLAEVTFNYSSTGTFDPSAFLLGSVLAPNGPFTVNIFGWPITHGWNYFWVGYKLTPGASLYNVLDVACESLVIDANTIIPSTTDPVGSRQINQPPPLAAGTYTVGVGGTYTHFYEAVQDLNCRGVDGPVVFEFIDTDYNPTTGEVFPVTIKTPAGVSAVNTVTFRPAAGVNAKIEGQTSVFPQTGLIILEGSDHIIFDGSNNGSTSRNLTIQNNSTFTSNCAVIHLKSKGIGAGATHNVIKNCNLVGFGGSYFSGTTIVHGVAICGSFPEYHLVEDVGTPGPNNDHNTIQNCSIEGTHTGIFVAGDAANPNNGLLIKDNEIGSHSNPSLWLSVSGITCLNTHHATIENNLIQNIKTDQPSAFNNLVTLDWRPAPPTGIVLGENMHDVLLHNNRILGVETVLPIEFGAKGIDISGVNSMNITVSNNVIAGVLADGSQTAPTVEGILFSPIGNYIDHSIIGLYIDNVSGCKVSHNTIHLSGQRLNNGLNEPVITAAFAVGPAATDLKVTNNIFNNTLTASNTLAANYNYAVYGRNQSGDAFNFQFPNINYNLYNASSTGSPAPVINNIGLLNGNDASNLASWQHETNQDNSSITVDVSNAFVDPLADLRVKLDASESWYLSGTGVHDSDNPQDADGVARPATAVDGAPDLGAYEFDANVLITNAQPVNAVIIPAGPMRNVYVANRLIGQFEFTAGMPPTLTAKYYSGIWPPDPTNNGLNPNAKYFNCYLRVDATGGSGYIYNHTYHYDEALIGKIPSEASIRPAKGEGTPGSWVYYTTGFTLDMAANTFTKPGLNSFSDFTGSFEDIVQTSGQLWLTGQKVDKANVLTWRYEAKATVLYFHLEHSNNGESWAPLHKSNQMEFTDVEAYQIGRYYRVKAVLTDGSMMYSNTIHISGLNPNPNVFSLFPNPVQRGQKLILHSNQPVDKLEVYDHTGKLVYHTNNEPERLSIPLQPELPTGVYTLRIYGLFGTYAKRFLVH